MSKQSVLIIGAGPAGLSAAYDLLERTDYQPIILEQSGQIGGISKTVNFKGNRIDIGGHRFFSKSDLVMDWWRRQMPVQGAPSADDLLLDRPVETQPGGPDPAGTDRVMLVRNRLSRIYFLRQFFDYPLSLSLKALTGLGLARTFRIMTSYLGARLRPIKPEQSLEDFLVNRFGRELYATFFRDYTEKVWGVACRDIKPEWGRQRIKGISITAILLNALRKLSPKEDKIDQKGTETSLIERFLYPKHGPGQMWELVAREIEARGGQILLQRRVTGVKLKGGRIVALEVTGPAGSELYQGEAYFSSMPVQDLVASMSPPAPADVRAVAQGLCYRDFMSVGLLLSSLQIKNHSQHKSVNQIIPDNWIYIQERDVKLGRVQVFNNWSPYMVADPNTVWLGLEYFCQEGDDFWQMADAEVIRFALDELARIGFAEAGDCLDGVVIREAKAYPGYFGAYEQFETVRDHLQGIENLYPVGRNGMHRYNNMDHSMLTAFQSVDALLGNCSRESVWQVNAEEDYHEESRA